MPYRRKLPIAPTLWRRPLAFSYKRGSDSLTWDARDPGIEVDPYVAPRAAGWRAPGPDEVVDGGRLLDDFVLLAKEDTRADIRHDWVVLVAKTWGVWDFCACWQAHPRLGAKQADFGSAPTRTFMPDFTKDLVHQDWEKRNATSQDVAMLIATAVQVNAFRALAATFTAQDVRRDPNERRIASERAWRVFWPEEIPGKDYEFNLVRLAWLLNGWSDATHLGPKVEVVEGRPRARLVAKGFADAVVWALLEEFAMEQEIGWCPGCGVTWRIRKGRRNRWCPMCRHNPSSEPARARAKETAGKGARS